MIALLTDFGNSEYVGVLKGVIYSVCRNAKVIDLTHDISPHNIKEAAWVIYSSYKYFPRKTIFLCVVDPGVGTKRQCIAIKTKNYFFVGPDNGIMHKTAVEDGVLSTIRLPVRNASMTFHGRDVFARATSMLEKGVTISKLGQETNLKTKLDFYLKGRQGETVKIDKFGNIITNLPSLNKKDYSFLKTKQ